MSHQRPRTILLKRTDATEEESQAVVVDFMAKGVIEQTPPRCSASLAPYLMNHSSRDPAVNKLLHLYLRHGSTGLETCHKDQSPLLTDQIYSPVPSGPCLSNLETSIKSADRVRAASTQIAGRKQSRILPE